MCEIIILIGVIHIIINVEKKYNLVFTVESEGKAKVFSGQEPLSGESTTAECGANYQLLAVIY